MDVNVFLEGVRALDGVSNVTHIRTGTQAKAVGVEMDSELQSTKFCDGVDADEFFAVLISYTDGGIGEPVDRLYLAGGPTAGGAPSLAGGVWARRCLPSPAVDHLTEKLQDVLATT